MELREKITAEIVTVTTTQAASAIADRILALPEIKEALEIARNLKANQERQRRMMGHSISTKPAIP